LDYLTTHTNLSPIRRGCSRLAAASDKVYQLLAHGWWFSPDTSASSTTKTDRHDIVEILLKVVALNTINQSKNHSYQSVHHRQWLYTVKHVETELLVFRIDRCLVYTG
jgi:hypothetical protein